MEAARHVRAGNHVEQRLVVAECPTTEAFAHIAVHIDSHSRLLSVCFLHSHRFHSFRRLSVVLPSQRSSAATSLLPQSPQHASHAAPRNLPLGLTPCIPNRVCW